MNYHETHIDLLKMYEMVNAESYILLLSNILNLQKNTGKFYFKYNLVNKNLIEKNQILSEQERKKKDVENQINNLGKSILIYNREKIAKLNTDIEAIKQDQLQTMDTIKDREFLIDKIIIYLKYYIGSINSSLNNSTILESDNNYRSKTMRALSKKMSIYFSRENNKKTTKNEKKMALHKSYNYKFLFSLFMEFCDCVQRIFSQAFILVYQSIHFKSEEEYKFEILNIDSPRVIEQYNENLKISRSKLKLKEKVYSRTEKDIFNDLNFKKIMKAKNEDEYHGIKDLIEKEKAAEKVQKLYKSRQTKTESTSYFSNNLGYISKDDLYQNFKIYTNKKLNKEEGKEDVYSVFDRYNKINKMFSKYTNNNVNDEFIKNRQKILLRNKSILEKSQYIFKAVTNKELNKLIRSSSMSYYTQRKNRVNISDFYEEYETSSDEDKEVLRQNLIEEAKKKMNKKGKHKQYALKSKKEDMNLIYKREMDLKKLELNYNIKNPDKKVLSFNQVQELYFQIQKKYKRGRLPCFNYKNSSLRSSISNSVDKLPLTSKKRTPNRISESSIKTSRKNSYFADKVLNKEN